jgi:hypothetical protein
MKGNLSIILFIGGVAEFLDEFLKHTDLRSSAINQRLRMVWSVIA